MAMPPSLTMSRDFSSLSLPMPTTTSRGTLSPDGRDDIEARTALAGKAVGGGGTANEIAERRSARLGRGAEFQVFLAEHNENTAGTGESGEAEFEGGGHGRPLARSWLAPDRRRFSSAIYEPDRPPCKAAFCAETGRVRRCLYQTGVLTL